MDLNEIEQIRSEYNRYDKLIDEKEREDYITLVANLHYPTILIGCDGAIVYKNRSATEKRGKWRVSSNLRAYMDDALFYALMATKIGGYVAASLDGEKIAILRFERYYLLIFMSDFELNSEHINTLYDYVTCIPEKNFLENRKLVPKEYLSPDEALKYESFRRKFYRYYKYTRDCFADFNTASFKNGDEKEHNIVDFLERIMWFINQREYNFSCRFHTEKRNDFFVKCSSLDLGSIFGTLVFLSLQCSCTKKPSIRFSLEENKKPCSCILSLSAKSDLTESEVEKYFLSDELIDERSLYYQTLKSMVSKYYWGFGVAKVEERLVFSLKIVASKTKDSWFHDYSLHDAAKSMFSFETFLDLLLGDAFLE